MDVTTELAVVPLQQETVGTAEEPRIICIIKDTTPHSTKSQTLTVPASFTASQLIDEVAKQTNHKRTPQFSLVWLKGGKDLSDEVPVKELGSASLLDCNMLTTGRNYFLITSDGKGTENDSLEGGACGFQPEDALEGTTILDNPGSDNEMSACTSSCVPFLYPAYPSYSAAVAGSMSHNSHNDTVKYVGLVNQAMTCYLNSLIQSLFMTPEFRNAVYRWEFDGTANDEQKSIPFQLQKLFVLLQTSNKRAIETNDLTRSFGWDGAEAWQQHDVQELCRVMFDALELKWKNTDQADLINQLYQGKMKDYVKCLDCGYESARQATFLDIPLVIRPFGSHQSYESVEDALRAFVQPETLDGSNQYFCEKCDKKCDAHKGLKFVHFPYVLTLQLKRFDFDHMTMHRIKLNDRMLFPDVFDLNSFISKENELLPDEVEKLEIEESSVDSGAENEDSVANSVNSSESLDEGIDIGASNNTNHYNESSDSSSSKNRGPFHYALFSVMIHSGSAAGGHYYAYIKSFADDQWYSFNDQSVSKITYADIVKMYGGSSSPNRSFYSSAYMSSTNAYMLMYRQIDPHRNANFMSSDEFPFPVKNLINRLRQREEQDKKQRELDRCTCKIKLFCMHPVSKKMLESRLEVHMSTTLAEATHTAHRTLNLGNVIPLSLCRLIKYDELHHSLECSYDGQENTPMSKILGGVKSTYMFDLLLETRRDEQTFNVYKPGGTTVKVHVVDLSTETIDHPITIRAYLNQTVFDLKTLISKATTLCDVDKMRMVLEKGNCSSRLLSHMNKLLKNEGFAKSAKVFVEGTDSDDAALTYTKSHLWKLLDRHANTITVHINLPTTADCTLYRKTHRDKANRHVKTFDPSTRPESPGLCQSQTDPPTGETGGSVNQGTGHREPCSTPLHNPSNSTGTKSRIIQVMTPIALVTALGPGANLFMGQGSSERGGGDTTVPLTYNKKQSTTTTMVAENNTITTSPETTTITSSQQPITDTDKSTNRNETLTSDNLSYPVQETCAGDDSYLSYRAGSMSDDTPLHSNQVIEGGLCFNSYGSSREATPGSSCPNSSPDNSSDEVIVYSIPPTFQPIWHFQLVSRGEDPNELTVAVDKRITLSELKKRLESYVSVKSDFFKIYRVYSNNQEFEWTRLNDTMISQADDTKIVVRLGRAVKKDENRMQVFQLLPNKSNPLKHVLDWIIAKGMSIEQCKIQILEELQFKNEDDFISLTEDDLPRLRLRKKSWKNPGTIFLNQQIYDKDIPTCTELFIEILSEPDRMKEPCQFSLFCRRWMPLEMKFKDFHEVIINTPTTDELRKQISTESGIQLEYLEFAKGKGTFPCDISILEVDELEWNPSCLQLKEWPLCINDDGSVIYYRDNRDPCKELTDEERREIQKRENIRLSRTYDNTNSNYLPRREKALKIYTHETTTTSTTTTTVNKTTGPHEDATSNGSDEGVSEK